MPLVQDNHFNAAGLDVPDVFVNIIAPPDRITGVPTNVLGLVGVASWGPVGAPISAGSGSADRLVGPIANRKHDLATAVKIAALQGVNNFKLVRVTDGGDTKAAVAVPTDCIAYTARYSGTEGNRITVAHAAGRKPGTTRVTVNRAGYTPEVFDNIEGSGNALWVAMAQAINQGQSGIRGPSEWLTAAAGAGTADPVSTAYTLAGGTDGLADGMITAVEVSDSGSRYTGFPTVTLSNAGSGSGLVAAVHMKAVAVSSVVSAGHGYAPGDTITLRQGGASSVAAVLTVTHTKVVSAAIVDGGTGGTDGTQTVTGTTGTGTRFQASVTVSDGAITDIVSITTAGDYTANPANIDSEHVTGAGLSGAALSVALGVLTAAITTAGDYPAFPPGSPATQASTSGDGSGAMFSISWGVGSIAITAGGKNYPNTVTASLSGGSPTVAATLGDVTTQNWADVAASRLVGVDGSNRTGMYGLRGAGALTFALVDCDDPATWSEQLAFALETGSYAHAALPAGLYADVAGAVAAKAAAGVVDYGLHVWHGDWCYFNDAANGVRRLVSPATYAAGLRAALGPEQSILNKPLNGVVGTESTAANRVYSGAELSDLVEAGIDVVTNPIPVGDAYGSRLGINCDVNTAQRSDAYTALTHFLAHSFENFGGRFVGRVQTPREAQEVDDAFDFFLGGLVDLGMIGDVNNPGKRGKAYSVAVDTSKASLGYQSVNLKVVYLGIIRYFIVNLEGGSTVVLNAA
ncbi:Phage tail sheath protein [Methylomagnum ishizawai]|uniref:Phage tail sheath protein n=1 Tax=Methylomagnum ishizawai TaxID=1760988 RepID=A0A1Y6D0T2_9GAMM|nr:hypothetical protein [Methylomagnum ishizawai]SMF96040.1 Phage tail sheath protein [Methylomagnum ishizawai]